MNYIYLFTSRQGGDFAWQSGMNVVSILQNNRSAFGSRVVQYESMSGYRMISFLLWISLYVSLREKMRTPKKTHRNDRRTISITNTLRCTYSFQVTNQSLSRRLKEERRKKSSQGKGRTRGLLFLFSSKASHKTDTTRFGRRQCQWLRGFLLT